MSLRTLKLVLAVVIASFLLSAVYVLIFVTQGILMVALALFGIADTVFGLRRRFGSRPTPPPTLSP